MWPARPRFPASTVTRPSSSTICSEPRASSAPPCWRPATMWPRVASRTARVRSIAPARRSATRAISCSPPRASSLPCCAFRSATRPRPRPASSRAGSACRSPTSTTARISASCPTGRYTEVIERLMPGAADPGDIVDLDGHVLGRHAGIIHFTVGQRRGLGIAAGEPLYVVRLDAANRRVVVGPRAALRMMRMRLRDVNWLGDGGSTARWRRAGSTSSSRCARRGRRSRPGSCATGDQYEVELRRRRRRRGARPGLRVLRRAHRAGARAGRRLHQERNRARRARRAIASMPTRAPRFAAELRRGRERKSARARHATRSISRHSIAPMRAGRRSMTSCSARCSTAAARPRSRRPSRLAGAFSTSASAPASRCWISRRAIGSSASISPSRCCGERASA